MGVDDEVGYNPLGSPGHVLLSVCHPDGPLLAMPARKLVAHLWHPNRAHLRIRASNNPDLLQFTTQVRESERSACRFKGLP